MDIRENIIAPHIFYPRFHHKYIFLHLFRTLFLVIKILALVGSLFFGILIRRLFLVVLVVVL